MKISLNWLNDYIETGLTVEELCYKLTMAGLEVEKVENVAGDTVVEMEITPNRPDLLNILGIAREVSAILDKTVKVPKVKVQPAPKAKCDISIEDKKGCSKYIGTLIEGVECGSAPKWILNRIASLGMRAVNNVVDITNFALMETGQPMHAFDYDKLIGGKIIVRRAKKGEKIITIDDEERELDPSILVIADEKRPVAIAGIMGGKETEVSSSTKNILLESAHFDQILVRKASRKLGLSSDASYRFERGIDVDAAERGSDRAIDLILEIAKGKLSARTDAIGEKIKKEKSTIKTSVDEINYFLGSELSATKCKTILTKLGFDVDADKEGKLTVKSPIYRQDVKREVDVMEEVARIVGYNNLPESLPVIKAANVPEDPRLDQRKAVKRAMLAQGYNEVVTYSMVSKQNLEKSGQKDIKSVNVRNALSQEQELMRATMLPSLLSIVLSNINKGQKDLRFFETGKTYTAKGEKETLGIIATGLVSSDWRELSKKEIAFYDVKGAVESFLTGLGVENISFEKTDKDIFEQGQRAVLLLKGKEIGSIGKIDQSILNSWDIKQKNVIFAQIDLEAIFAASKKERKYIAITEYPSVGRDISLAIKKDISFDAIRNVALQKGGKILTSIEFKEEYMGDKIQQGHRGVVFSLTYQSLERTLTEEEVNVAHSQVLDSIISEFAAIQR